VAITNKNKLKYGPITDLDLWFHELSNLRTLVFGVRLIHKKISNFVHRIKIFIVDDHVATLFIDTTNFINDKMHRFGVNSKLRQWEVFNENYIGVIENMRVDLHYPPFARHIEANLWVRSYEVYEISLRIALEPGHEIGRYLVIFNVDSKQLSSELALEEPITPDSVHWLHYGR
jgi:hypothetical protein